MMQQRPIRAVLPVSATAFAVPGNDLIGTDNLELFVGGTVPVAPGRGTALLLRRMVPAR